jgi:hypothetical protein
MSPNEPLPILRMSRYLLATMKSPLFDVLPLAMVTAVSASLANRGGYFAGCKIDKIIGFNKKNEIEHEWPKP